MSDDVLRREAARDKLNAVIGLTEEVRAEFEALAGETKAENVAPAQVTQSAAPVYNIRIKTLHFNSSSTARLEQIMTDVVAKIDALTASLDASSVTLTKVTDEFITTVADLTDKLAAALAAGESVPAEVTAAIERAQAKADAIQGQANELDGLTPDPAPAPNPVP